MLNVKDQVYAALCKVTENVTDAYPRDWAAMPAIQFAEEENKVSVYTDMKEQMAYVQYRIDIWNNKSTSEAAVAVDKELAQLGLKRTQCQDIEDPNGHKHKLMRYEMIIDVNTQQVYQNG